MTRQHVHRDDCPQALAALEGGLFARKHDKVGLEAIGWEPTETGAWVDWDALEHSWLSSTEKAAVVVARGIAMAERHGDFPPRLHRALMDSLANAGGRRGGRSW